MVTAARLPEWAHEIEDGRFLIDGNVAYPMLLEEIDGLKRRLGKASSNEPGHITALRRFNKDRPDQYWLEVVYQFAKLDLRRALLLAGESGWPSEIRIRSNKSEWRIASYPEGRGIWLATRGREARAHYIALRGFIPN